MLSDQEITAIWNEAMNKAESIALNKSQTMELLREVSRRTQSEAVRTEGVDAELRECLAKSIFSLFAAASHINVFPWPDQDERDKELYRKAVDLVAASLPQHAQSGVVESLNAIMKVFADDETDCSVSSTTAYVMKNIARDALSHAPSIPAPVAHEECEHQWHPQDQPARFTKLDGREVCYVKCAKCGARSWLSREQLSAPVAESELREVLNYVADMTYCGADAEWHLKPRYDPQRVLNSIAPRTLSVLRECSCGSTNGEHVLPCPFAVEIPDD